MQSEQSPTTTATEQKSIFRVENTDYYYGSFKAVRGVNLEIPVNKITAFIGPSGCGKSTVLRCFNRLNDLIAGAHIDGRITFHGQDIYSKAVDPTELRRRVGMVFQSRTPSRSPSTTTLPLVLASMATRAIWMSWWSGHCAARPMG